MVKKRFDETDSFINTVLTEANWDQANIKVKLTEESKAQQEDEDSRNAGRGPGIVTTRDGKAINASEVDDEDEDEDKEKKEESVELGYDACPLCESELENDDVIFENIDTHFSNLLNLVDQVEQIQESEDFDGEVMIESVVEDGCCPLCESAVEDDSVILNNMNEHFDVVLEMLEEAEQLEEGYGKKKPLPKKK